MADSIMQKEKVCFFTGSTYGLDKHHVIGGSRRSKSEKWGCWVWLRHDVHMDLHERRQDLSKILKATCQKRYEELYGHDKWMEEFGKSYLEEDEV